MHFLVGFFLFAFGGAPKHAFILALASSSVTGTFLFARYSQLSETPVPCGKGKSYSSHFFGTENHGHTLTPAGYPCPSFYGCTLRSFANGDESGRRRGPGLGEGTVHHGYKSHPIPRLLVAVLGINMMSTAAPLWRWECSRSGHGHVCMYMCVCASRYQRQRFQEEEEGEGRGGLFGKHCSQVG